MFNLTLQSVGMQNQNPLKHDTSYVTIISWFETFLNTYIEGSNHLVQLQPTVSKGIVLRRKHSSSHAYTRPTICHLGTFILELVGC